MKPLLSLTVVAALLGQAPAQAEGLVATPWGWRAAPSAQQASPQHQLAASCIYPVNDKLILDAGGRIASQIRDTAKSHFNTADRIPLEQAPFALSTIPTPESIVKKFLSVRFGQFR